MTRRGHSSGLNAFFGWTAFDLDAERVQESSPYPYYHHRLRQVAMWMPYLNRRLRARQRLAREPYSGFVEQWDEAMERLDVEYLHAVERALHEMLRKR